MNNTIAIINAVPYGSTGKITKGIAITASDNGLDVHLIYSWTKERSNIGRGEFKASFISKAIHMGLSRITGLDGGYSVIDTIRLINHLKKIKPEIINLHVIHSWGFNIPLLMRYIKRMNIPVVWTFHDCWAFTGHCPNFTSESCYKWKTGCHDCPLFREYPKTLFDNSRFMWRLKKKWFNWIEELTVVTPSNWMKGLVKESFLKDVKTLVIRNGIDLEVFHPIESNFREKYCCIDKTLVLGVALGWSKKKGLDTFIWLSKTLPDNYQIILVGTTDEIDQQLPQNIISIHRTDTALDLAKIYSAADVFVNPTLEDNYPTVNLEALSCGTPIISYRTGGSPETFDDSCGVVVEYNDKESLKKAIISLGTDKKILRKNCLEYSKRFDQNVVFRQYIDLFNEIIGGNSD